MVLQMEKLDNGNKLMIYLRRCGKCQYNLIEEFVIPVGEECSSDELLMKMAQDKKGDPKLKVKFNGFKVQCPTCGSEKENITYLEMTPEQVELLSNTPIENIFLSRDDI